MEDETEKGELDKRAEYKKIWRDKKGNLHRLDGPAITHPDGDMSWYKHGVTHREDGPALEWPSENVEAWYKNGLPYEPSAHEIMAWKMKKKEG